MATEDERREARKLPIGKREGTKIRQELQLGLLKACWLIYKTLCVLRFSSIYERCKDNTEATVAVRRLNEKKGKFLKDLRILIATLK